MHAIIGRRRGGLFLGQRLANVGQQVGVVLDDILPFLSLHDLLALLADEIGGPRFQLFRVVQIAQQQSLNRFNGKENCFAEVVCGVIGWQMDELQKGSGFH